MRAAHDAVPVRLRGPRRDARAARRLPSVRRVSARALLGFYSIAVRPLRRVVPLPDVVTPRGRRAVLFTAWLVFSHWYIDCHVSAGWALALWLGVIVLQSAPRDVWCRYQPRLHRGGGAQYSLPPGSAFPTGTPARQPVALQYCSYTQSRCGVSHTTPGSQGSQSHGGSVCKPKAARRGVPLCTRVVRHRVALRWRSYLEHRRGVSHSTPDRKAASRTAVAFVHLKATRCAAHSNRVAR
jgi:hypothetical protein